MSTILSLIKTEYVLLILLHVDWQMDGLDMTKLIGSFQIILDGPYNLYNDFGFKLLGSWLNMVHI